MSRAEYLISRLKGKGKVAKPKSKMEVLRKSVDSIDCCDCSDCSCDCKC